MCAESPWRSSAITSPGSGSGGAVSIVDAAGSTRVVHTVLQACFAPRLRTNTSTGAAGRGKRSDSWKVRVVASPVVVHSSYTEPKPRE